MVMWMSRIERKKIENKSKRFFKLCLFLQIVLLICGLLAVDFQIRRMLGIDEVSLIGYKQGENGKHIVHVMGDSYLVDSSMIKAEIHNKFAQLKEIAYSIKEWIEQKW